MWRCGDGVIHPPRGREQCIVSTTAATAVVRAIFSLDYHPLDRAAAVAGLPFGQRITLFAQACSCGRSHWSAGVNLARVDRLSAEVKDAVRRLDPPPAVRVLIEMVGLRDPEKQLQKLRQYAFGGRVAA